MTSMSEKAHARNTDPYTSHEAAASITSEKIRRSQLEVNRALRRIGPCEDSVLVEEMQGTDRYAWQSESGIRTRRKELVDKGLVVDTGERVVKPSGRKATVWACATRV